MSHNLDLAESADPDQPPHFEIRWTWHPINGTWTCPVCWNGSVGLQRGVNIGVWLFLAHQVQTHIPSSHSSLATTQLPEKLQNLLVKETDWDFDIIQLERITNKRWENLWVFILWLIIPTPHHSAFCICAKLYDFCANYCFHLCQKRYDFCTNFWYDIKCTKQIEWLPNQIEVKVKQMEIHWNTVEGFLYVIDDRAKETPFWSAGRKFWKFWMNHFSRSSRSLVCLR